MLQNYDFFLFCELARYDNKELTQEPYDTQFPVFLQLFNEYENSHHSKQDKGTYECIQDFLHYKEVEKEKLTKRIQHIISEELPQIYYNSDSMIERIQIALKLFNITPVK
jgi:hypothetical protein